MPSRKAPDRLAEVMSFPRPSSSASIVSPAWPHPLRPALLAGKFQPRLAPTQQDLANLDRLKKLVKLTLLMATVEPAPPSAAAWKICHENLD